MKTQMKEKIKKAPNVPGVYFFKNKQGKIIYIGRAVNLKNRLKNYISPTDPKTQKMTEEANSLSWQKTKNLLEAIILEANYIKKYQPFYNIREKDNRSFVYIVIPNISWSYPKIVRAREVDKYLIGKSFIFGPLQSYSLAKNFLFIIRKIFPYSTCRYNQEKPCFYYQIGLCSGKCLGKITEKDYKKLINALIAFLSGKKQIAKNYLKKYSPKKLPLLNQIDDTPLIITEPSKNNFTQRIEGYDISHFGGKQTVGSLVVFENGNFISSEYKKFKIKNAKPNDDLAAIKEMIERRFNHLEWPLPNFILIDGGKTQVKTVEDVLKEKNINIPVIGIAKFNNDKIVFGKNIKKSVKDLITMSFKTLQKIRDEAHRFANAYRKQISHLKKSANK